MNKTIICWKLKFDSWYFQGCDKHDGTLYENRHDAVSEVENLKEYFEKRYMKNMNRRIIHTQFINNASGVFDDKYWYRMVVVNENDYPEIISFGCELKRIYLKRL